MKKLLALLLLAVPALADADTFKLKDGTTVEGMIKSEDNREFVVSIEYSGGTITRQERIAKSNVVEVVRLTAEQVMEHDYAATQRYRLDPQVSFPVEFYNQAISNVFLPFVGQYANSVHVEELTEKIREWELERDLVAGGQARYGGKWVSLAAAAGQTQGDRARRALQQGKGYLAQRWYESAIGQLRAAGQMTNFPEVATEARQQEAEAYRQWVASLEGEQRKLGEELQRAQQEVQAAQGNVQQQQSTLQRLREKAQGFQGMGQSGFELQKANEIKAGEANRAFKEQLMNGIRLQQEQLAKKIADVQARAGTVPSPAAVAAAAPVGTTVDGMPRATSAPLKAPDVLESLVQLVQTYWIAFAGVFLLVVWIIFRSITS